MKRIFEKHIGMIAVAMTALILCGCAHSPEQRIESSDWAYLNIDKDDLPHGWQLTKNLPPIDKTPWWVKNPMILSADDGKEYRVFEGLPSEPEEAYFCYYNNFKSQADVFVVTVYRFATPEQAKDAYEATKSVKWFETSPHGRYLVMLGYNELSDNVRRIRIPMLKKLGLPLSPEDQAIASNPQKVPAADSVKGGVVRRGDMVEFTSDLEFVIKCYPDLKDTDEIYDVTHFTPGTVSFNVAENPYWIAEVFCDDPTPADFDRYIKEAVEGEFCGFEMEHATDEHLKALVKNKALKILKFEPYSSVTDKGIECLLMLPQIEFLALANNGEMTDVSLATIGQMRNLKRLHLFYLRKTTGAGLAKLSGLTNLQALRIGSEALADEHMKMIAQFKDIEDLHLTGKAKITDLGIKRIAGLKKLKILRLGGLNNITDESLDVIAGFKDLKRLEMWGCDNLSAAKIEWLKEQLPDCEISS